MSEYNFNVHTFHVSFAFCDYYELTKKSYNSNVNKIDIWEGSYLLA